MDGFTAIEYAVTDRVARVTLARPEAQNALSMRLRLEVVRALRMAESDRDVTVVVLEGKGESFCAGYDLKEPYGSKDDRAERGNWVSDPDLVGWTDQFARSCLHEWMTAWDLLKPVIAIVHGNCLAGGTELMSFADIVFAADDARIGYPPMRAMSTPDIPIMPGMRTHLAQAWAWHYLSGTSRPNGGAFFNHVKEDGLKAALQWMNGPFKDEGLL